MRQILCLFLIICVEFLLADETNDTYCFKYRWVEPIFDDPSKYNCTLLKGIPCIEPLFPGDKPPNTTELWQSKNYTYYHPLPPSNVCIKYTYIFDNKIVNTSLFFGKVVEEGQSVTTGCYEQYVNGYTIKMCACLPNKGMEPCNTAVELKKYSTTLVIMLSFFISVRFT